MTIVVEDGTGLPDSNSYASVADADAYWTTRANNAWTDLQTANKEIALIKATDYLDARFGGRFVGKRHLTTQALEWPRDHNLNMSCDVIPPKLKQATFEYAVRAASSSLSPDPVVDAGSGVSTVVIKQTIGPIETTKQVLGGKTFLGTTLREYPMADMQLRGLVVSTSGVIR